LSVAADFVDERTAERAAPVLQVGFHFVLGRASPTNGIQSDGAYQVNAANTIRSLGRS
jgi:hypothetical protein